MVTTETCYLNDPDFKCVTGKGWVIHKKDIEIFVSMLEFLVFNEHQVECLERGEDMTDIETPTGFFGCHDSDDYLEMLMVGADSELSIREGYNRITKCDIFRIATYHYYS